MGQSSRTRNVFIALTSAQGLWDTRLKWRVSSLLKEGHLKCRVLAAWPRTTFDPNFMGQGFYAAGVDVGGALNAYMHDL